MTPDPAPESLSPRTMANYWRQWHLFEEWCFDKMDRETKTPPDALCGFGWAERAHQMAVKASANLICSYLVYRFSAGAAPSTLRSARAAITWMHKRQRRRDPLPTSSVAVKYTLRTITKLCAERDGRAR